jgi:hypothetical protein
MGGAHGLRWDWEAGRGPGEVGWWWSGALNGWPFWPGQADSALAVAVGLGPWECTVHAAWKDVVEVTWTWSRCHGGTSEDMDHATWSTSQGRATGSKDTDDRHRGASKDIEGHRRMPKDAEGRRPWAVGGRLPALTLRPPASCLPRILSGRLMTTAARLGG